MAIHISQSFRHLFITLNFLFLNEAFLTNATYISTPYYPAPFTGSIPRIRVNATTSGPGKGIAVLFDQFLVGPADCVFACEPDVITCDSLCGDVMDHPNKKKILRTNASTVVTLQTTGQADDFPHSGVHGKIVEYDLKEPSFFDCNRTVNLLPNETFFLVSQNYPASPMDFNPCFVTFQAEDGIRFALYDMMLLDTEFFTINGTALNGSQQNITYSGQRITSNEPFGVYFQKSATIDYKFLQQSATYEKRFYILVNSFKIAPASSDPCNNAKQFQLNLGEWVFFGTIGFPTEVYAPNADCQFNFTNPHPERAKMGFAIAYESEKCCDTMAIDGLSGYHDVYQGEQLHYFSFAVNTTVQMHFISDAVIEGPGFNATATLYDCSCGQLNYSMTSDSPQITIGSPGQKYGTTYCPEMDCTYTVYFPDNEYELTAQFNGKLRNYYGSHSPDTLIFIDHYGRVNYQANPLYFGPNAILFTASPFTFRFTSNNMPGFPIDQMNAYYLIANFIRKRTIISKQIRLTSTNPFCDINTGAFKQGYDATYEFQVSTDPGLTIAIYFFTSISGTVKIDIYDGDSTTSNLVDNRVLYSNIHSDGASYSLQSSGANMLVRVRCDTEFNSSCGHDFQAMVSSIKTDTSCGSMVYSLQQTTESKAMPLTGKDCVLILHATDSTYDSGKSLRLSFSGNTNSSLIQIYKGLHYKDAKYLLANQSLLALPSIIYDRYITVHYSTASNNLILKYFVQSYDYLSVYTMRSGDIVSFMSKDYLADGNVGAFEQQFSVEMLDASLSDGLLKLTVLNAVGDASGSIEVDNYDDIVEKKSYSNANGSFTYEARGTKIVIGYVSQGSDNSGLNARVEGLIKFSNYISNFIIFIITFSLLIVQL